MAIQGEMMSRKYAEYEGGAWEIGGCLSFGPPSDTLPDLMTWRGDLARLIAHAQTRAATSKPYAAMLPVLEAELCATNERITTQGKPKQKRKIA